MSDGAGIMAMENDVYGADDLAEAIYSLVEGGASHGLDAKQVRALLRCVGHLQDYTSSTVRLWEEARCTSRPR